MLGLADRGRLAQASFLLRKDGARTMVLGQWGRSQTRSVSGGRMLRRGCCSRCSGVALSTGNGREEGTGGQQGLGLPSARSSRGVLPTGEVVAAQARERATKSKHALPMDGRCTKSLGRKWVARAQLSDRDAVIIPSWRRNPRPASSSNVASQTSCGRSVRAGWTGVPGQGVLVARGAVPTSTLP